MRDFFDFADFIFYLSHFLCKIDVFRVSLRKHGPLIWLSKDLLINPFRFINPKLTLKSDLQKRFRFICLFIGIEPWEFHLGLRCDDFAVCDFALFDFFINFICCCNFFQIKGVSRQHQGPDIFILVHNEEHIPITLRFVQQNEFNYWDIIDFFLIIINLLFL